MGLEHFYYTDWHNASGTGKAWGIEKWNGVNDREKAWFAASFQCLGPYLGRLKNRGWIDTQNLKSSKSLVYSFVWALTKITHRLKVPSKMSACGISMWLSVITTWWLHHFRASASAFQQAKWSGIVIYNPAPKSRSATFMMIYRAM